MGVETAEIGRNIFDGASVEGMDFAKGLRNFSADVYEEVLRAWCRHTPGTLQKLESLAGGLAEDGKLEEYGIAVHGFKGSSYGICADELGKEAAALEAASREGDTGFISAANPSLLEKAAALHGRLAAFLAANAAKPEKGPKVAVPDTELLSRLLSACGKFSSSAVEQIINQLESFEYESGGDLVEWLRLKADDLEYEEMAARLEPELKKPSFTDT